METKSVLVAEASDAKISQHGIEFSPIITCGRIASIVLKNSDTTIAGVLLVSIMVQLTLTSRTSISVFIGPKRAGPTISPKPAFFMVKIAVSVLRSDVAAWIDKIASIS